MEQISKNTGRHYVLKFISITLAVLALLASFSSCKHEYVHVDVDVDDNVTKTEQESTNPTITVNSVNVNRDNTDVEITVSIKNNPGIVGMTLSLDYDESAMTLTAVDKGSALGEMTFTTPKNLSSGCNFPWDAEYVLPENATNDINIQHF